MAFGLHVCVFAHPGKTVKQRNAILKADGIKLSYAEILHELQTLQKQNLLRVDDERRWWRVPQAEEKGLEAFANCAQSEMVEQTKTQIKSAIREVNGVLKDLHALLRKFENKNVLNSSSRHSDESEDGAGSDDDSSEQDGARVVRGRYVPTRGIQMKK